METESKLTARLRVLARQSAARAHRSRESQPTVQNQSSQSLPVENAVSDNAAPYSNSMAFKLPPAYSNTEPMKTNRAPRSGGKKSGIIKNRCSKRKAVRLSGIIKNEGSTLDIDVFVKDMSMCGMCLVVDRDNPTRRLPAKTPFISDMFLLHIPFDKMTVQCKLIWRDGDTFGAFYNKTPQFQR